MYVCQRRMKGCVTWHAVKQLTRINTDSVYCLQILNLTRKNIWATFNVLKTKKELHCHRNHVTADNLVPPAFADFVPNKFVLRTGVDVCVTEGTYNVVAPEQVLANPDVRLPKRLRRVLEEERDGNGSNAVARIEGEDAHAGSNDGAEIDVDDHGGPSGAS